MRIYYVNTKAGRFYVYSSSHNKAEEIIEAIFPSAKVLHVTEAYGKTLADYSKLRVYSSADVNLPPWEYPDWNPTTNRATY